MFTFITGTYIHTYIHECMHAFIHINNWTHNCMIPAHNTYTQFRTELYRFDKYIHNETNASDIHDYIQIPLSIVTGIYYVTLRCVTLHDITLHYIT